MGASSFFSVDGGLSTSRAYVKLLCLPLIVTSNGNFDWTCLLLFGGYLSKYRWFESFEDPTIIVSVEKVRTWVTI
jgi:hypothetical protein